VHPAISRTGVSPVIPTRIAILYLGARWIIERVQRKLGKNDPADIRGCLSFLPRVQRSNAAYEFVGD
jgi:hypothetical protein